MATRVVSLFVCLFALVGFASAKPENLALAAKGTASEFQPGYPSGLANDGKEDTRWSGIPGHNSGVWYQLEWTQPVLVGQLIIKQFQTFSWEWDIQVWDDSSSGWKTIRHDGKPNTTLPLVVVDTFDTPTLTKRLRIGNITHGPSFNEVEVYASPNTYQPIVSLASDLRGNFVGMVSDAFGSAPIEGKTVDVLCETTHGVSKLKAISNEKGLFFVKMPVGLIKTVYTEFDDHQQKFPAAQFQRAITPQDSRQWVVSEKQDWKFQPDPPTGFEKPGFDDSKWKPIKVPAHWEMEGFKAKTGVGGYRTHFQSSGRTMIRFDGVYSGADIWVNGVLVATHLGGFTPFEADITRVIHDGDNVIAVRANEHTIVSDQMDKMSLYADFGLGGIMRSMKIFTVGDVHIEGYEQQCLWAPGKALVAGRVSLINAGKKASSGTLQAMLVDASGKTVAKSSAAPFGLNSESATSLTFSMEVLNPHQWNAEQPYLYTLKFELVDARPTKTDPPDNIIQTLRQPIGLRQTTIQGSQILINNTPVKFKGTCHHDQHPTMGRAVTPELERMDLDMIKGANLNSVRTSHYPPLEALIDYADKIGLYVEDEADFCWVGVSNDLRNTPRIIQLTGEMIARDRNHPSVFMWSLCNESEFGYGFERSHDWVRQIDPSRPTAAAISAWLEIATLHNPISIRRIEENEKLDKPMLFDEAWCIYQGIFNDVAEMWVDPGMRDYYAEPLKGIWDAFMKSKVTQGSQIWAWSDDIFCVPGRGLSYGRGTTQSHFVEGAYSMPGRGLAGDAPWGVVDGWRREKPEYWITKHLQSSIHIEEHPITPGGEILFTIRNDYDFTNLSEISFRYTIGKKPDQFNLTVKASPHSTTDLKIRADDSPVILSAYSKSGKLIDRWQFSTPPKPLFRTGGPAMSIKEVPLLAGNTLSLEGHDFHLSFDQDTGFLRECFASGQPTLLELPTIHILPTATPEREMPSRTTWRMDSRTAVLSADGKTFKSTTKGSYPDLEGKYEVSIDASGTMMISSEFTYTGKPMFAREVGMRFSVPRACNLLSWNRNPEFGWFPDNHIGRATGSAFAFAKHAETVPPTWGYAADNSPMGSNDFRSTKRHLNYGSIRYQSGAGVGIFSDGSQALRAIVDTDRITVHVSDWYGGTNVGWGEWISNYGRGKEIKTGDVLRSTLKLDLVRRK